MAYSSYTFSVDEIDFDFSDSDVNQADKDEAINSVLGKTFEVRHEDQVMDFLSDLTGWCVDSICYHQI